MVPVFHRPRCALGLGHLVAGMEVTCCSGSQFGLCWLTNRPDPVGFAVEAVTFAIKVSLPSIPAGYFFRLVTSLVVRHFLLDSAVNSEQLLTFINGDHRISVNGKQLQGSI